jgi:predicted RNA methylase
MSKLTKKEAKNHLAAMELVNNNLPLTEDEKRFILNNYDPNANHMTTISGAFFTPENVARDFAIVSDPNGVVVDLCAGIGMLGYKIIEADNLAYGGWKPNGWASAEVERLICIELNEEYVKVGKRILPEAEWILGSVFDQNIVKNLGQVDCVISNPPFGMSRFGTHDPSWVKFHSNMSFDLTLIALATEISNAGHFILPYGKTCYDVKERKYRNNDKKLNDFIKKTGFVLWPSAWDLSPYQNEWNGASPDVEFVSMEIAS